MTKLQAAEAERDALAEALRAVAEVAEQDSGLPCWCGDATWRDVGDHFQPCLAARAALARLGTRK